MLEHPHTYHNPFLWHLASVIVIALAIIYGLVKAVLYKLGKEKVVVYEKERTPFVLVQKDDTTLTVGTEIVFANEGKQVCTIMDALMRPLLPSEQYDGVFVRGRVVRLGAEREDDYFEAVLIEKGCRMKVRAELTFIARQGKSIEEAISELPDFLAELIWEETGRTPWHYEKVSLHVKGREVAALLGEGERRRG